MRIHRTKTKGDLGVLHAQLDLAEKGFGVLAPLTEHEAFDLVAYRGNRFLRIAVIYILLAAQLMLSLSQAALCHSTNMMCVPLIS